jgi:hypothetical protein
VTRRVVAGSFLLAVPVGALPGEPGARAAQSVRRDGTVPDVSDRTRAVVNAMTGAGRGGRPGRGGTLR